MNKLIKTVFGSILCLILVSPCISNSSTNSLGMLESKATAVGTYTTDAETYYGSDNGYTYHVANSDSSTTLLTNVHNLLNESHQTYNSYDDLKTLLFDTDEDPDMPGNIVLIYSRSSVKAKWNSIIWNREHVWCQSLGGWSTGLGPGSDVQHLRPANYTLNSTRNNNPYGVIADHSETNRFDITDCYLSGGVFEPADNLKGDIARIIMYDYAHYDNTVGNTPTYGYALSITNIMNTSTGTDAASWALINQWNVADPIDYAEIVRNNRASSVTGTRNAFIDHPEYGEVIWGGGKSIGLSTSNFSIATSGTKTLTAYAQGGGTLANVSWSSSDNTIATVSNGVVTGLKNGVAYITVSGTVDGTTYTARSVAIVGTGWQPKGIGVTGTIIYPITSSTTEVSDSTTQGDITFSQPTGTFQQLTSGNSFTMTVSNFNKNVKSVNLYMHSNKSTGTMSVSISVGGTSIENESSQAYSHYFNQNYDTSQTRYAMTFIDLVFPNSTSTKTGDVVINVSSSANSLYYDRITIDYETEEPTGRTDAVNWAQSFLDGTATECTNLNVTTTTWDGLSSTYGNLETVAKAYFYNNSGNTSETVIYAAASRYLFIINKYGYTAFVTDGSGNVLSDNINSNQFKTNTNLSTNGLIVITIISCVLIITSMVTISMVYAKKHRGDVE